MFYELFKSRQQKLVMFDGYKNRLAFVPADQVQLAQTLQYRSLLAIVFYSLLQFTNFFQPLMAIIASIGFYLFLTFFYVTRLTPRMPWLSVEQVDISLQDDLRQHFAKERLFIRAGVLLVLAILLLIQVFSKPSAQWSNNDILTLWISIGVLLEIIRQLLVYQRYTKFSR